MNTSNEIETEKIPMESFFIKKYIHKVFGYLCQKKNSNYRKIPT